VRQDVLLVGPVGVRHVDPAVVDDHQGDVVDDDVTMLTVCPHVPWCDALRVAPVFREEKLERITRAIRVARDSYSEHAAICEACTPLRASAECSIGRRLEANSSELEVLKKALESPRARI
jgi:hypothetical protein